MSDLYSSDSLYLFKKGLVGGEIWNDRNSLSTTDEENNPWNVEYSGSVTPFSPIDSNNSQHHFYRFIQNLDITDFLQKKSLGIKNNNPSVKNWKFFIAAGSDAHGSFNYSNTEFTFGVSGAINDNALGKITTLTFCPNGMGANGRNVLNALKNGNTILSDGPIVNMGISTDMDDSNNEIYIGQDTVLTNQEIADAELIVDSYITPEFGNINKITLTGITQDSISFYDLPLANHQALNLQSVLNNLFGSVPTGEYFMIRASLHSLKDYGSQSSLYCRTSGRFFSITNPIWIKTPLITSNTDNFKAEDVIVRPNPVHDKLFTNLSDSEGYSVKIVDMNGRLVKDVPYTSHGIDVKDLSSGFFMATFLNEKNIINKKIIISH